MVAACVELAGGDPFRGNLIFGSPLAVALTTRAAARYCLGLPQWCDDLRRGLAMAHSADPLSYATVVAYVYFPGIPFGALVADDRALGEIADALRIAERSGDDMAVAFARAALGVALVHRHADAERDEGERLLAEVGDVFLRRGHNLSELRLINLYLARAMARRGDLDEAIKLMFAAVDQLVAEGQLLSWGCPATVILAEALLTRRADGDLVQADVVIERLAAAASDGELALRDIWLLRARALSAHARGDAEGFAQLLGRYRSVAKSSGLQGHIAWAEVISGGANPIPST